VLWHLEKQIDLESKNSKRTDTFSKPPIESNGGLNVLSRAPRHRYWCSSSTPRSRSGGRRTRARSPDGAELPAASSKPPLSTTEVRVQLDVAVVAGFGTALREGLELLGER